ncbi:sugar ABC transporter substrate-binding protein [Eubacteriales bacterium mix99]
MKKSRFSTFLIFLCTASLLLPLGACGSKGKESGKGVKDVDISNRYELDETKPAWQLDKKEEKTELTWYVNADWWDTDWGKDIVTQQIEEDLNLKIKFSKGDDTNLNTMFAGEDMTDFVTIFDEASKVAKDAKNWAYSLNDLSKKYDPYWNKVAARETMEWLKLDDGKTYGYPSYSNTSEDYKNNLIPANSAFFIRQDVYKAIGEPKLGTQQEFIDAMSKIREKFPDLIPFGFRPFEDNGTGSLGEEFQDFIGVPLETEDGKFYNRNLDEDYLSWLGTFRKIYNNGGISDDSFADDPNAFEEKVKSGQYATIQASGTAQMGGALQTWLVSNPDAQYIAIDGPQSTKGNEPKLNQTGISGWMVNYISKSCKDPAKAMQFFTYLQSEYGGILTNYGIEGKTFEYNADHKIKLLPEVEEIKDNDPERYQKEYRLSEFIFFGHDKFLNYASEDTQPKALEQQKEWGKGKLYPHFILENTEPDPGTADARNASNIQVEWSKTLINLVRSKSEKQFNANLDSYKKFLDSNGWEDIEKVKNEKIKQNKEKLGID